MDGATRRCAVVQLRKMVDLLKTNAAIAAIRYGHFATFFPSAVSTNSTNSSNKEGDAHRPRFCQLGLLISGLML